MILLQIFVFLLLFSEGKETHFIRTGISEKIESKDKSALVLFHCNPTEKYFRERESWQELEKYVVYYYE